MREFRPAVQEKVYAFTQQDLKAHIDVVQGMYTIYKHSVYVLIDIGCIHSFILHTYAWYLNISHVHFDSILLVSTPASGTLIANIMYKSCIVKIIGRELSVDLISLNISDYDVILGMQPTTLL